MFKTVCYFIIILYLNQSFATEPSNSSDPKSFVKNFCENYDSQKDFFKKMSSEILSNEHRRKQLVLDLTQKNVPKCEIALKEYMKRILEEDDYTPKLGEQAFLSLALIAKIPEASTVIAREIDKGYLSSWIDTLKDTNDTEYINSLNSWIKRVATEIRKNDNFSLKKTPQLNNEKEIKYPDMVRIWTPILMNRYLNEIIQRKTLLNEEQFGHLNIIYAATTPAYRITFSDQIAKIVSINTKTWISSFKKESMWVEFRLFPIMEKVGSYEIRKELEILSNSPDQNDLIKNLAKSTLEKLRQKKYSYSTD